jgi:hypothetical protein
VRGLQVALLAVGVIAEVVKGLILTPLVAHAIGKARRARAGLFVQHVVQALLVLVGAMLRDLALDLARDDGAFGSASEGGRHDEEMTWAELRTRG